MEKKYELHHDLLSIGSFNPFARHNSSQRGMMSISMMGQMLITKGRSRRHIFTGAEREYAKATFSVKAPCNMEVVRVIEKFPTRAGQFNFAHNPEKLIIYKDLETLEYGVISARSHHHLDTKFGWEFVPTEAAGQLYRGNVVPEATVLYKSPAVLDNGDYAPALETMTALMSVPAAIEDGVQVTESYCKRLTTTGVKSVTFSIGKRGYPLNLYGDDQQYRIIPDIGERVGGDGLLLATREYNPETLVYDMTPKALRTPDHFFDQAMYIEPHGRIIDIDVRRQNNANVTPPGMVEQLSRYHTATQQYYNAILSEYRRLRYQHGDNVRITPAFQDLVTRAFAEENGAKDKVTKMYRNQPIDEWHVTITYEHDIVPGIGFKLSDFHGGKGVIVDVIKDEETVVDARGHRAEVIMDDKSTIKRMNLGRLYERYSNATLIHVEEDIKIALGMDPTKRMNKEWYEAKLEDSTKLDLAFKELLDLYQIISPLQYQEAVELDAANSQWRLEHVSYALSEGIDLWLPADNPVAYDQAVRQIEARFKPLYEPVSYVGKSGKRVTTKDRSRVAPMYIMLLEKVADDWAAVSSAKRQHYGVPAKISNFDRHANPARQQPTRATGESEVRNYVANVSPRATADMIDRSTNPTVHRQVCESILNNPKPTNIPLNVDRDAYPIGYGRIQMFIKHIMECDGLKLTRVPTPTPKVGKQK